MYNAPEVVKAIEEGQTIYVNEGEKGLRRFLRGRAWSRRASLSRRRRGIGYQVAADAHQVPVERQEGRGGCRSGPGRAKPYAQ